MNTLSPQIHNGILIESIIRTLTPLIVSQCRRDCVSRVFFYGAGKHTEMLLKNWKEKGGPTVAGILVSQPGAMNEFIGTPVIPAEKFSPQTGEGIVLSSAIYESQMASVCLRHWPQTPCYSLYTVIDRNDRAFADDFTLSAGEFLDCGLTLLAIGRKNDAIRCLRAAIAISPDLLDAYIALAGLYEGNDMLREAIDCWRQIIDLKAYWPEAHQNLGRLLLQQQQFEPACRHCNEAIRLNPELSLPHLYLGVALLALGKSREATDSILRTISLGNDSSETYFQLGVAFNKQGMMDRAISSFKAAAAKDPGNWQIAIQLGSIYALRGDYFQAIETYENAIRLKPSHDLYSLLGDMHIQLNQLEQAVHAFSKAIELQPLLAVPHYKLGYAQTLQGKISAAVRTAQTALLLNAGWHERHVLLRALLQHKLEVCRQIQRQIRDPLLSEMLNNLLIAPEIFHPSSFWLFHLLLHVTQIETSGIENFKRTVNLSYFNWVSGIDKHVENLHRELALMHKRPHPANAYDDNSEKPDNWASCDWDKYLDLLRLLARFVHSKDQTGILSCVSEPPVGNPLVIRCGKKNISQDLCNSVLEANSILEHIPIKRKDHMRIAELGAGYGRLVWVLQKVLPDSRITIIDIPPALYVSQWYFSKLLPSDRIFKYRDFSKYEDIKDEFESASVSFLLSSQVPFLPDNSFDMFINIASLQEMNLSQIRMWFDQIQRLCSGYFYIKQYNKSVNDIDNICIERADYPVKSDWVQVFSRTCTIQDLFFEALYQTRH